MERPRLVPQLYGYAVCLVAVVTILIASGNLIEGLFDTATPEMSREVAGAIGGSFEMYKQRRTQSPPRPPDRAVPVEAGARPDSALRAAYEDERAYMIQSVQHHGLRRVVGSGLTLLIALAFFITHWRWLRGMARVEAA